MEYKANEIVLNKDDIEKYKNILNKREMMREIIYSTDHDMVIFQDGEVIVVFDDTVTWLQSNNLKDMVLLQFYLEKFNLSESDREGITAYILELYDEWKGK